ncbi:unnamed protein product [Withania somnifera]
MSQGQPQRPETEQHQQEPLKYGDVFNVTGELAEQPIAPQDVLGQYVEPLPVTAAAVAEGDVEEAPITIGEALAATALVAGEKPVEQSDAAAIQAAEARATGSSVGATARLPADKAATRQDAQGVMEAEIRNNPNLTAYPGGVAASVAAAARLNERSS